MGAWIEIGSQPSDRRQSAVAPLVGAWIEISPNLLVDWAIKVAPLVGAWIEISTRLITICFVESAKDRKSVV